jgi:hypothetical protein
VFPAGRVGDQAGAIARLARNDRGVLGPVSVDDPTIAVLGAARLLGPGGAVLVAARTAGAPAEADALRALTVETSYVVPPLVLDDSFRGPALTRWAGKRYHFEGFYHPHVCRMMRELGRAGVPGLFDPSPTGPEPGLRRQQLVDFFFERYATRRAG